VGSLDGKQITMRSMVVSEEIKAGVIWAGVFWVSISSNSYLADLSGAIQLHHGTNDTSVPVEFSETLNAQIRAAGGVVEYYVYTGDDHALSRNLNTALARSVAFFDRYVK
jgi:uncharacterized protein